MPAQLETEATVVADLILARLRPVLDGIAEAEGWYTKEEFRAYWLGRRHATEAVRDAVVRALEDGVFADMIATGQIPRHKTNRAHAA